MTLWTRQEQERLAQLAPLGISAIRRHLPGRADTSIRQKAEALGITIRLTRPGAGGNTRWRGRIPIPAHTHPLVRKLIEAANREQTTLKEIAAAAGLCPETVSDWRYRRRPTVDHLIAAFNVLGLTLVVAREQQ